MKNMKRFIIQIIRGAYICFTVVLVISIFVCCSSKGNKTETAPSDEEIAQEATQEEVDPIMKLAKVAADADWIYNFQEGLAGFKKEGKVGVVNINGDVVVPPTYDGDMSEFSRYGVMGCLMYSDGMARVKKNGKYGFIDKNGKEVIPCTLDNANSFSGGYAVVNRGNKYGIIDKSGKQIVPYKYDYISNFNDGAALVVIGDKYGFINTNGEEIIPIKYDSSPLEHFCCDFYDGLAVAIVHEDDEWKFGYINKSGKVVIDPIYEMGGRFRNGLAVVQKEGKYGYIDKNGKEMIPFLYDDAKDFVDGMAVVHSDGKYQILDKSGKAITEPVYTSYVGISEGLAIMGDYDANMYGVVDNNGKEIVPLEYPYGSIVECHEGLMGNKKNGKWGFLDKSGKQVIPCVYDNVGYFSDGYAVVSKDGIYGYVDKEGKCTLDISDSELKSVITNKKEKNEKKERAKEAEKERKKLEEQNTSSSSQVSGDVSSILYECQNEITAIQREIEEACRTFVVLGSQDVDMYKYTQMKSTFLNGVNNLERKADKAFDKCAKKLKDAGYPDAVDKINEEKRQFHSAIYSLTTRATQQTDMSY